MIIAMMACPVVKKVILTANFKMKYLNRGKLKFPENSKLKVHLNPKYFFRLNKSLHLFETHFAFF